MLFNPRRASAQASTPSSSITFSSSPKKFADETPGQQQRHREIAEKYSRRRSKLGFRLRDLRIFLGDRYGGPLPERGARVDLIILLHHVAQLGDPSAFAVYRARWFPWITDQDLAGLIAMIEREPLRWDADPLAEELDLDYATRTRLGITTIGATDFPKRLRTRRRKKLDKERKRASRIEAGAVPHAMSAAQTKPWLDLGISRATYFRRRQERQDILPFETRETDSSAAAKSLVRMDTDSQQARRRPLQKGGAWARAVLALSAGERVVDAERVQTDGIFLTAARERNSKTETPLKASSINMHAVAKSRNAAPQQIREVFSMPKMQVDPSPRDLAADHAEAARNPTVLRKLTRGETESFIRRRETFDKLRQSYPNQPAADAAVVDILFNRMLLDRHSFVPLVKTISDSARALREGRVKREDLPTLKRVLVVNWNQAHHVVVTKLRVAA